MSVSSALVTAVTDVSGRRHSAYPTAQQTGGWPRGVSVTASRGAGEREKQEMGRATDLEHASALVGHVPLEMSAVYRWAG